MRIVALPYTGGQRRGVATGRDLQWYRIDACFMVRYRGAWERDTRRPGITYLPIERDL